MSHRNPNQPPPPPQPPDHQQPQQTIRSSHPACAACRYQRRKCTPECPLAKYFPPDRQEEFLNAHKLFGVSNIVKMIKSLENKSPHLIDEAMKTMIFQSNARAADPVGGCCRIIWDLQRQIEIHAAELNLVRRQLAFFRAHHRQQQMQQPHDDPDAVVLPPHMMDHSSTSPPSSSSANNVFSYSSNNNNGDSSYMQDLILPPPLSYHQNQQQQQQQQQQLMFHNLTLNDQSQELLGLEDQLEQNGCPNSNFQGLDQWLVHDPSRVSMDGGVARSIYNHQQPQQDHEQEIITRDLIDEKPCKRKREEAAIVGMINEDARRTLPFDDSKETIEVIRVAENDDEKQKIEVEEREAKSKENVEEHDQLKEAVPLFCST